MPLSAEQSSTLLDLCQRNFKYQTPTPVVEHGRIARYNVTIFASDYGALMGIIESAGDFEMPEEDKVALLKQFAEKAKTAGGEYDLKTWSLGELEAALEDTEGVEELAAFRDAVDAEAKKRAAA